MGKDQFFCHLIGSFSIRKTSRLDKKKRLEDKPVFIYDMLLIINNSGALEFPISKIKTLEWFE